MSYWGLGLGRWVGGWVGGWVGFYLLLSNSCWISSRVIWTRGGQPSTTTPTPPPWDSP